MSTWTAGRIPTPAAGDSADDPIAVSSAGAGTTVGLSRGPQPADSDDRRPLQPGVATAISPLVRRILCANPSFMTGPGTNTYLVGIDEIAVVDPGPVDLDHTETVVGCGGDRIRWIVCTHSHPDHAPGAAALADRTGARVVGFGAREGFAPDTTLGDGETLRGTEFTLRALHTPGHASDHLCLVLEQERLLFSGDHVMEGSTVVVPPPDGDMAAYLASLRRLRAITPALRRIAPGHGHVIEDPAATLDAYIAHRLAREGQILDVVGSAGQATIGEIVAKCYPGLDEALRPVAARSVWAHLRKLESEGTIAMAAGGRTGPGEPGDPATDPDRHWRRVAG